MSWRRRKRDDAALLALAEIEILKEESRGIIWRGGEAAALVRWL
jgi:hypothetical protein